MRLSRSTRRLLRLARATLGRSSTASAATRFAILGGLRTSDLSALSYASLRPPIHAVLHGPRRRHPGHPGADR